MTDDWLLPWLTIELDNLKVDVIDRDSDSGRILNEDLDVQ